MSGLLSKPEAHQDDEVMLQSKISPLSDLRLHIYHAWVGIWLSSNDPTPDSPRWTVKELAQLFQDWKLHDLLDMKLLRSVMQSFQSHVASGKITLGGAVPPSCADTNILSQTYNPQTECACDGLYPVPDGMTAGNIQEHTSCRAMAAILSAQEQLISRPSEWSSGHGAIFTVPKLTAAVEELLLANADIQPAPSTCTSQPIPPIITAPDRRPSNDVDSDPRLHSVLFPTFEAIKLCADAKHFFAMACGASAIDRGLLAAIADAGNDILIGDYAEAASPSTLALLQRTGAAAFAFLKLCHLAGTLSDWHFNTLAAAAIQFRVLAYYRDHARPRLPPGVYGSRMSALTTHRHIDLAIFHGVLPASLATGAVLAEPAFMRLAEACTLLNDMVDLRSDAMRRQRENVVLRGFPPSGSGSGSESESGSACAYLDALITRLLTAACTVLADGQLSALVLMAFCNWAVMSSHHKLFELLTGLAELPASPPCRYASVDDPTLYDRLLALLRPFGTLGACAPAPGQTRAVLDQMYGLARMSADTHVRWLADVTRALLVPRRMRHIVDVVHLEWKGSVGDVEYCP